MKDDVKDEVKDAAVDKAIDENDKMINKEKPQKNVGLKLVSLYKRLFRKTLA